MARQKKRIREIDASEPNLILTPQEVRIQITLSS